MKLDFEVVKVNKLDENWVMFMYIGEVIFIICCFFIFVLKNGYIIEGIVDGWYCLNDNLEVFYLIFLVLMVDIMFLMFDIFFYNGIFYDGNNNI